MKTTKKFYCYAFALLGSMLILFSSCSKDDDRNVPVLSTTEVTEITHTIASSGGNITDDGGAVINSRGLVWSTSANPSIENHTGMSFDGAGIGTFVSMMTALEPETDYFVRAWATNKEGTAYGQQINFTTSDYPAPVVITAPITEITRETATGGGQVVSGEGYDVIARGVVWSTSENPAMDNNEGMTLNGSGLGEFTSNLTGLSLETTYYLRAYASNAHKTGYGEQVEFTTEGMIVTDIDGNVYPTVVIGNQEWMAANLRVTRYRNGEVIPSGLNNNAWIATTSGAYAIQPHDNVDGINSEAEMVDAYGKYYNWYAVVDERGLCPEGWSLASDGDWKELEMYLGMSEQHANSDGWRGGPVGGDMKALQTDPDPHPRWNSPNTGATNESGFSGLPGGARGTAAAFHSVGTHSWLWTSTQHGADNAWGRVLRFDLNSVFRGNHHKSIGFSVRCIRD